MLETVSGKRRRIIVPEVAEPPEGYWSNCFVIGNLVLNYDLEILPTLMQFDGHAQGQWPIHAIDREAVGDWIDDRLVSFVKTYLSLHENEYYLKEHMVRDPVAGVRFPKYAAAATVDVAGKTYYFIGDETRREFEAQQGAGSGHA